MSPACTVLAMTHTATHQTKGKRGATKARLNSDGMRLHSPPRAPNPAPDTQPQAMSNMERAAAAPEGGDAPPPGQLQAQAFIGLAMQLLDVLSLPSEALLALEMVAGLRQWPQVGQSVSQAAVQLRAALQTALHTQRVAVALLRADPHHSSCDAACACAIRACECGHARTRPLRAGA